MLRNFDTELDSLEQAKPPPKVTEVVTITVNPPKTFLAKPDDQWDWSELRDYIIAQIEEYHGPTPRLDAPREASVFRSFLERWGSLAPAIARYAFGPDCKGYWKGAPIGVSRFYKKQDAWFANDIAARLR